MSTNFIDKIILARKDIDARNLCTQGTIDPGWRNSVNLKGKVVKGAANSGQHLVIAFEDGTFIAFEADVSGLCESCEHDAGVDLARDRHPDIEVLHRAEAISDEEHAAIARVYAEKKEVEQKARADERRRQYERLKAEFEPKVEEKKPCT